VVSLNQPFSAARARNVGFKHVTEQNSRIEFVQFIDGDCELCPDWVKHAVEFLKQTPICAVVCGILKERNPETSIYNRLCQLEWEKSPGEIKASGGIFMVRVDAFRTVNGFTENVIAAEDDEFCLRLRQHGWTIHFLGEKMAIHDANMTQFSQWWRRAYRAGHAYAQGNYLHGKSEHHFSREVRSIWIWGLIIPIFAIAICKWTNGLSLGLFLAYPMLIYKVYCYGRRRGWSKDDAYLYSMFAVLAKLPSVLGMIRFWISKILNSQPRIIEHKLSKNH
jgi:GT2 family glycosyltransferase